MAGVSNILSNLFSRLADVVARALPNELVSRFGANANVPIEDGETDEDASAQTVVGDAAGLRQSSVDDVLTLGGDVRRTRLLASVFPCMYHAGHDHPVGKPHTCNDFLLGPRSRRPRVHRLGAHSLVISFASRAPRRGRAA